MSSPGTDLSGKVAVVTGGTRGLGRRIAEAYARAGAMVVIASRKADACAAAAQEIMAVTGGQALGIRCHIGKWSDCDSLFAQVVEMTGGADILVNNAGMSPLYDSLTAVSEELWDKVIDVNLRGAFRLGALFGEHMAGRPDGGSIINVSSIAAVEPKPQELPYGAAKAGLNAVTVGLARAFAPKVRVNCIMCGPFLTDVSASWDPAAWARRTENEIPLRRGGRPDEIVGAALYLAGSGSSFTTGAVIKIDGGAAFAPA
jgi:NAD(P)-dependent dehydrogenase (short-subunit alcohol dehydrogenase family)